MIFTLNVGNTNTSLMGWHPSAAPWCAEWATVQKVPSTVLKTLRANAGSQLCVASVVPDAWSILQKKFTTLEYRIVSIREASRWDLTVVPQPATRVGEDRIAGAFGAIFLDRGRSWVVVDTGTAMTINAISVPKKGPARFEGGLILPGAALSFRALATGTAQLPQVEPEAFASAKSAIGRNTKQAMHFGVLQAQLAAAVRLAALQVRELGGRCGVVLTGGMSRDAAFASAFVASFRRRIARIEPDLVHRGLLAGGLAAQFGRPAGRAKQR